MSDNMVDLCEILRAVFRVDGQYLSRSWIIDYYFSNDIVGIPIDVTHMLLEQGKNQQTVVGWQLLVASAFVSQTDEACIRCVINDDDVVTILFTDTSVYEISGPSNFIDAVQILLGHEAEKL